ncbi:heat shock protein Hsp20 [Melioribacter roseus P3M-2]|jgi:HSP20 family protein|uniref:Heat shock protein Hsp20 n=1 Tax=Melioribacter roseus (strain DSM 23840 / JCM 17771 / VKM B-2668 / P3M-2) TaxID=1191523 RepID=I6ZUG4_MELRP|nr:Hsp20/alpha crystallin family protein [Melioribacter roseus]AFN75649.1 heat shock protein Hsp20 [Melioribacter roseus P3M-2]
MAETKDVMEVQSQTRKSWEEALERESWVAPLVDIYETDNDYYLNAYLPGVTKDNLKIKLEDEHLIIMGRINFDDVVNRKYVLKETETGNFYRSFKIGDSIDESNIEAHLENGILEIRLPKHERVKPRTIEIK